jgi:hypothetical protein
MAGPQAASTIMAAATLIILMNKTPLNSTLRFFLLHAGVRSRRRRD